MNLNPYLKKYTKINLKCIINLNIKAETIKLKEENMKEIFATLADFLGHENHKP